MLPIHAHDKTYRPGWRIKEKFAGWFRLIFSDKDARNLFMFLVLNLSMAFVELFYGMWTNSLGLISDSFHMFFDCTALLAGLIASLISKWRANEKFSYGYVRAEVMAGFVNGLFLLFIAFFIMSEAVERAFEPPEIHHERLFIVSVAGFIVNIIGIFAFQHGGHGHSHGGHGHSHGGHGHSHSDHGHGHSDHGHDHGHSHGNSTSNAHTSNSHGHSHGIGFGANDAPIELAGSKNKILQGVFLHILADTLGSVGVIISSSLIHMYGWMIADPVCSMFISVLIGLSTIPLLQESIAILMQRQPYSLDAELPGCYQRVSQLEGVYGIHEPHFWTLCSDTYIGAVKVEVSRTADLKYVKSQTHNIFSAIGVKQLFVEIDQAEI